MRWPAGIREPRPIGDGICEVPLSQGKVALIDECDAPKIALCNWHASTTPNSTTFYAKGRLVHPRIASHMHRAILCFPVMDVDHINGNGLDNRRCNLRLCEPQQNMCNIRPRANKTSRFRGVWRYSSTRWQAAIRVNRTLINLGMFTSEERAAAAYDIASELLHGRFGVRNGCCGTVALRADVLKRIASYQSRIQSVSKQA
jgi:hypothetical protein